MESLKRLFGRSLSIYRHDGFRGFLYATFRKALWRPRDYYRLLLWRWMLRQSKQEPLLKEVHGVKLYLNPDDHGISMELGVDGTHEPILTDLLRSLISEGMTVVDIGGNIGYFPLIESRLVGPTGKVIVFEPSPVSFSFLQRNIEANKAFNIVARNLAIGNHKGSATLYTFERANWNSLVLQNRECKSAIKVELVTLDELLGSEPRVDVIRMDVEGYECKIIHGMRNILKRHKPLLVLELHANLVSLEDIAEFLNSLQDTGYAIKWAFPRIKDEVFIGSVLTDRGKVLEKLLIEDLMHDDRLTVFKVNFSIVFEPKS